MTTVHRRDSDVISQTIAEMHITYPLRPFTRGIVGGVCDLYGLMWDLSSYRTMKGNVYVISLKGRDTTDAPNSGKGLSGLRD